MSLLSRSLLSLGLIATALPAFAAQAPIQNLDQFPSFIELTSQVKDGTQTVLRCGYALNAGKTVVLDPGYQEVTVVNHNRSVYSRLQHIDEYIVQTSIAPNGSWGLMIQVIKPDGSLYARNCQTDMNNDTIYSCKNTNINATPDQVKMDDRDLGAQCNELLNQSASQINPAVANVEKSKAFRDGLRAKIKMLDAVH